jgi:molybdopterin molybdotransferase
MGNCPTLELGKGKAAKISTGGMLPGDADAVVMIEYCHPLDAHTVEVARAVSPLENVIQPGDDFREGSLVLPKGHRLRSQDLGVMAGLGFSHVQVHKRPQVAILSTGDEIIPVNENPAPGQVRDINQYTLGAFCRRNGAEPLNMGICPDDLGTMREKVLHALQVADSLWISGGSSVGVRDLTLQAFEAVEEFELLVHGISISPGKPTIIGKAGKRPIIGVPGHVASALVVAEVFLSPLIRRLSGLGPEGETPPPCVKARLSQNIESASGREDYVRVKIDRQDDTWIARPVFGKSGLISILVESDGLVRVDMNTEGLYRGDMVDVLLFDG